MEGRPPPDLHQQDLQEKLESISSMSDNLSLAPTDIYFSPTSTPRSMSVSSAPVIGRRDSMTDEMNVQENDIWKLPDFGASPVSSPPRTPPPEPTPPPTPPPEELTDEEEQDSKDKEEQEAAINNTPSCEECKTPVKPKEKRAINSVPIFKREGGRLSNTRIDSKSLRASSGPSYAAPVIRQNVPSIPEPKQYKPRRPPRITKKTKKPTEKPDENHQAENPTGKNEPNQLADSENTQAVNEAGTEENLQGRGKELVRNDATNDPHKRSQQEELKSVQASDTSHQQSRASSQNGFKSAQEAPRQEKGAWKNMEQDKEMGASESQQPQETVQDSASQQKKDKPEDNNDTIQDNEVCEAREENTHLEEGSGQNNENRIRENISRPCEEEHYIELNPNLHDRFDDLGKDALHVVYVDPETGETMEGLLGEVPKGAKITEIKEDPYNDTGSIASGRQSKQKKRQKSVTFDNQQNDNVNRSISFSKQKRQDLESDAWRTQKGWASRDRTYVVPSGDTNHDLHEDLVIKGLRGDSNVSPLAIFALARSRKETAAKQARRAKSARSRSGYAMYSPDKDDISRQDDDSQTKPYNLDVVLPTKDAPRPSSQLSGTVRAKSSKKPEDDVVKWCINALRKSRAQLSIPDKPSRPGSSQSAGAASDRKDDGAWVKKVGVKDGHTLFINLPNKSPRPNSSATFQSTDSKEDYAMYPDKGLLATNHYKTHSTNQTRNTRAKTAPPGRGRRTNIDQKREEVEGDVQDGLEFTRDTEGYYTDSYRFQSSDDRPASSLDFPSLDVDDYSGNWQEIVLARARLLKQQRLERQKSAKERRQTHQNQLKERWQKTNHFDCTKAESDKPEQSVEFLTSSELALNQIKPNLPENTMKQLKEQELSSEQPFRLRIQPRHGSASLTRPARSIMTVMANDHNVEDIARVMQRPKTAASIPNKCSRFVLVAGDPNPTAPKPTKMEKTLMMTRFPNDRVLKKNRAIRHGPTLRKSVET